MVQEVEVVEEEEDQDRDEELRQRLKQEQKDIMKWQSDYIQLMEYVKNPKYISQLLLGMRY